MKTTLLSAVATACALVALAVATACDAPDKENPDEVGACEVKTGISEDTCYEWPRSECSDSDSYTFHPGATCPEIEYADACCSSSQDETPNYYRPSGMSCDSIDRVCGSSSGGDDSDCYSSCVEVCLEAGGSTCGADCSDLCG